MKTSYSTSDFLSNKTKINDVILQNMYKNLKYFSKKIYIQKNAKNMAFFATSSIKSIMLNDSQYC